MCLNVCFLIKSRNFLGSLLSLLSFVSCTAQYSMILQFSDKIINNPHFLCLYPINFLRLSNQYAVNQSVQYRFVKFRNSSVTPDFLHEHLPPNVPPH